MTSPIRLGPSRWIPDPASCAVGAHGSLQEQPFTVLLKLLERPGEVVTREELTRRLWSDNTFVDFDRGLNKAINRLREVLRDSAEKPRFIETLPQRGYRFIATVESAGSDSAVAPSARGPRLMPPTPRIDSWPCCHSTTIPAIPHRNISLTA